MIKIGDFARLTGISVRSLRHYDELGLFKPAHVNEASGHRYYSLDQLPRLNRITALKNLGLSLKQITDLLKVDLSADEIRGMLLLRRAELHQLIEAQERCLTEVENSLKRIEQEGRLSEYAVVLKQIEPLAIVSNRPDLHQDESTHMDIADPIQRAFFALYDRVQAHQISVENAIGIYHNPRLLAKQTPPNLPYAITGQGLECGFTLTDSNLLDTHQPDLCIYELPPIQCMATVLFKGSLRERAEGSLALYEWAGRNNCTFTGPVREIYLRVVDDNLEHPENLVEIQFPVAS